MRNRENSQIQVPLEGLGQPFAKDAVNYKTDACTMYRQAQCMHWMRGDHYWARARGGNAHETLGNFATGGVPAGARARCMRGTGGGGGGGL